ncbi:Predicted arabinose efflux permease, MFS family [Clostridium acidisoli DSM 12555]|jgi:MFS family permease|uniref:Predicted arabinose efflux permease, MFS family n=1 Tax=Clostridium acidisoli DSM 12555 TaxID=1121291 RepID=A0A1W1XWT2_9CLOT|nr:MFS transporter [Clostridium acidisoli]SMC27978.1 Predicted arabinose efflux permease, MFS family [Clostridium acidisoli DSM 12555]
MNKLIYNYKGLPKGMYILFFAQVINRLGDFVMPFLALYLTQKIGMTSVAAGIIVTVSSIITIPASMIGGKIADKFGRKKSYMYSQFISAAALIPCAVTKDPHITVVCLLISTFFNGFIRPAFTAMMTDILSPKQRQAGFSLQYLGINVGVSIGPIIAGFLFNNLLPMLFLGDALTSFLALILVWRNIEETKPSHITKSNNDNNFSEKAEMGNVFQMLYKRPHICFFMIISIAYSFTYSQHNFALPITLKGIYGNDSSRIFGLLMSVNAITVLVLTVFITALTKKKHPLTNMIAVGILYAIGFGMIGHISSFSAFVLSTVIWTAGEILSSISSGVYIANNSPSNYRGRLSGISSVGWGIGSAVSTSISGVYIQANGYKSIWTLTLFVALVSAALMFLVKVFSIKLENKKVPESLV